MSSCEVPKAVSFSFSPVFTFFFSLLVYFIVGLLFGFINWIKSLFDLQILHSWLEIEIGCAGLLPRCLELPCSISISISIYLSLLQPSEPLELENDQKPSVNLETVNSLW